VAEKPPSQLVVVAAVGGVGEEAFLQVFTQHIEEALLGRGKEVRELSALQFPHQLVLLLDLAVGEGITAELLRGAIQCGQPEPVGFYLVRVRPRQCTIQVGDHPYLGRAGSVLVGREHALEERRRGAGLVPIEGDQTPQRRFHTNSS
jgi:hypothetical protein